MFLRLLKAELGRLYPAAVTGALATLLLSSGCGDPSTREDGSLAASPTPGDSDSSVTKTPRPGGSSEATPTASPTPTDGHAPTLSFLFPATAEVYNPVDFGVEADALVVQVTWTLDDTIDLGTNASVDTGFLVSATVDMADTHSILATGLDRNGKSIATAEMTFVVNAGLAPHACYPGADDAYTACHPLSAGVVGSIDGYDYPSSCGESLGVEYRRPTHLLDLYTVDESEAVAANFQLGELAQAYKGRFAIVQPYAVAALQALRDAMGPLTVNSGYRNPDYNASIGGAGCSRHTYGDGFDVKGSAVDLNDLASGCYDKGAGYVQIYETHVHCDWRDGPADTAFYGDANGQAREARPTVVDATLSFDGQSWHAPATGFDEGEPQRQWRALDRQGLELSRHQGRRFSPPADTASVHVIVGGLVRLSSPLP